MKAIGIGSCVIGGFLIGGGLVGGPTMGMMPWYSGLPAIAAGAMLIFAQDWTRRGK